MQHQSIEEVVSEQEAPAQQTEVIQPPTMEVVDRSPQVDQRPIAKLEDSTDQNVITFSVTVEDGEVDMLVNCLE